MHGPLTTQECIVYLTTQECIVYLTTQECIVYLTTQECIVYLTTPKNKTRAPHAVPQSSARDHNSS